MVSIRLGRIQSDSYNQNLPLQKKCLVVVFGARNGSNRQKRRQSIIDSTDSKIDINCNYRWQNDRKHGHSKISVKCLLLKKTLGILEVKHE